MKTFLIWTNILWLLFLRDLREGHLPLKYADHEQSNFAAKIKNLEKGEQKIEKEFFKVT